MKQNVKQWFINHKPSKRRLIQIYAALLYNANIKGFISGNIYTSATTKYMCVPGLNCYSCPGAVGACPLGALQNALAESGTRAPYYILGILGIFGLMLARTICGFLCPIGMCQELLYKIRTPKLRKSRVTRVLSFLKYVILALAIILPLIYALRDVPLPAFCKYICPAGTFGGAIMLLLNPNNAGLFGQLGWQFTWKFSLLVVFIVASVFIFRFFCRFFCPLGAIYGFFNRFALIGVKVNKDDCTECGLCVQHCKMDIKRVGDHECINCGECISICPAKAISWKGSQIFLHKDAINEVAPNVAPLAIENGVVSIPHSDIAYQVPQAEVYADTSINVSTDMSEAPAVSENAQAPAYYDKAETFDKFNPAEGATIANKRKKPAKFWLEMTAWILALVLLLVALVCYNFVDIDKAYTPPASNTGYGLGQLAPDFTVKLFDKENNDSTFNLYSEENKKTVIYFWTEENPNLADEMFLFNELAKNHTEINVIALHSSEAGNMVELINEKGWNDYTLSFAQDNVIDGECQTFKLFGGTDILPLTVVINENGLVIHNDTMTIVNGEQLETAIAQQIGYHVNDIAPDFTIDLYRTDGEFNLYSHRGKVTVVNFWATWCTPCVEEIPYFNELAKNHPELNVIAIHGSSTRNVEEFIASKGWSDYVLTFAQDNLDGKNCLTFKSFGGKSAWPMTVIVDENGIVIYNSTRSFRDAESLETLVTELLAEKE